MVGLEVELWFWAMAAIRASTVDHLEAATRDWANLAVVGAGCASQQGRVRPRPANPKARLFVERRAYVRERATPSPR